MVVLEGPPGIGKSRLLDHTRQRARELGVRTLFGQGYESHQATPFHPLFSAMLHADPPVGDAEAFRRFGDGTDVPYWIVHDLRVAIHAAAAQQPLSILLDDVHWADNGTLLALRSLTSHCEAPVLWILSVRSGAGGVAARRTMAELHRAGATFLPLSPLTPAGVAEVVQDAVRANADQSLLELAAKAHGSPFLLTELLRGLNEEERLEVSGGCARTIGDRLPRRLAIGMEQRLDELSADTAAIVRVAATLPDRFSASLLAAVLQRPPAALVSGIREAVQADLLVERGDHLTFRHDVLRDATRESMPRSLCRAIERQTVTAMLEMGAAPDEVAIQLARCAEPGDQTAIAALRQAALAVGRSDPSAAADLGKRAIELLPAADCEREPLVAETLLNLNRAHRYREARELADTTLSSIASQDGEAEIRLRVASGNEAPEQRIADNRRALQLTSMSEATRARHLAWLAYFEAVNGMHVNASTADEAFATATANGDLEARLVSATALGMVELQEGYASKAVHRMDETAALARSGEPTVGHIVADVHRVRLIVTLGCLEEARTAIAASVERARRDRYAMALPPWAILDGLAHVAAGRLASARAAIEALPRHEWGSITENNMMRLFVLSEIAARTDDRQLLQRLQDEARSLHSSMSPMVSSGAAYVLGLVAWHRGDVHDAVRWLGGHNPRVITPLWLNVYDQLILMSRVASAAGDAGLRARVLHGIEVLERERPVSPVFAAVALHGRGILERDFQALLDAASALRTRRPLLYAAAAEDAGTELSRADRHPEAIQQLNAAFDSFITCEAVADARRVGRALRKLGVERRIVSQTRSTSGWDSLTAAELRVVNVIAEGATNREAAARLHLSQNTVKAHVRNAFAKLGIHSRIELSRSPGHGAH